MIMICYTYTPSVPTKMMPHNPKQSISSSTYLIILKKVQVLNLHDSLVQTDETC